MLVTHNRSLLPAVCGAFHLAMAHSCLMSLGIMMDQMNNTVIPVPITTLQRPTAPPAPQSCHLTSVYRLRWTPFALTTVSIFILTSMRIGTCWKKKQRSCRIAFWAQMYSHTLLRSIIFHLAKDLQIWRLSSCQELGMLWDMHSNQCQQQPEQTSYTWILRICKPHRLQIPFLLKSLSLPCVCT